MRRKLYIVSLILAVGFLPLGAQQMSQLSFFSQNQTYFNPAATGNHEALAANFFYKETWVGMPGAASTQVFSVHAPMKNPKVALGILVEHESIGITNYTSLHASYAYRLSLGKSKLALALRAGIVNGAQNEITSRDEEYDPVLEDENMRFWVPDFGFGVLYTGSFYWAGLSVPGIFGFETNETGKYAMKAGPEYLEIFLTGGADLKFSQDWGMEPSLLVEYCPAFRPRLTINALGVFKDAYRAGLGYRHKEAIIMLLSIHINRQFALGYSYDLNIGETSDYSSGSHEINLHYKFGYKVNASNPRGF